MWTFFKRIFSGAGKSAPAQVHAPAVPEDPKGFSPAKLHDLEHTLDRHVWHNRLEIRASTECMCTECYSRFPPSAVKIWQDGSSAVCPNPECGCGGAVIGSASGLFFEDYDYSEMPGTPGGRGGPVSRAKTSTDSRTLHIIYNGTQVLLSKRRWSSRAEIQATHADYEASLGPFSGAEAIRFLQDEYGESKPSAADQVRALEASSAETVELTFYRMT